MRQPSVQHTNCHHDAFNIALLYDTCCDQSNRLILIVRKKLSKVKRKSHLLKKQLEKTLKFLEHIYKIEEQQKRSSTTQHYYNLLAFCQSNSNSCLAYCTLLLFLVLHVPSMTLPNRNNLIYFNICVFSNTALMVWAYLLIHNSKL